jgi:pimeloyl-ACP methyl ester carboxylesterase
MEHAKLTVHGLRIHYHVEGAGPDVVFVHGWGASRRMWSHLSRPLAQHYRCWSLDLPGCGDSDKPARTWYSIPNYTATVAEFMEQRGLSRARLVGHSMGGMIVLNFAAHHPQAVERLVAINPVVTGRARLRPLASHAGGGRVLDWVLRLSPRVLTPLFALPLGERTGGLHFMRRRAEDFCKGTPDSLVGSGQAVIGYDLSHVLPQITTPTLVIIGDKDVHVPASEGRLAARLVPHARLHQLRAGHQVTDDRPDEVLDHLLRFLT